MHWTEDGHLAVAIADMQLPNDSANHARMNAAIGETDS